MSQLSNDGVAVAGLTLRPPAEFLVADRDATHRALVADPVTAERVDDVAQRLAVRDLWDVMAPS